MAKNILIYADGTGQRSGIFFEEKRSNIYKLYRATHYAPDVSVNPAEQQAFYDPGIGTEPLSDNFFVRFCRRIYNLASQATGLGLTRNIIDCYAALIRMWEPGDRIFLFGFSRGAYTVRCLANAISLCGIPTHMTDGSPLRKSLKASRKTAAEAVRNVYQHTRSVAPETAMPYQKKRIKQRTLLASRFRQRYGSNDGNRSNTVPHFIGVFDTVSAVARKDAILLVIFVLFTIIFAGAFALSRFWLDFLQCFILLFFASILFASAWYLHKYLRMPGALPGFSAWETISWASLLLGYDDTFLDPRVTYARHAISIDEDRKSFPRVPWQNKALNARYGNGMNQFEQYWFAGNHSDIGGSYDDNESRLSDISLQWMLDAATLAGLKHDPQRLHLYPDACGMQHDERRLLLFRFSGSARRTIPRNATLHPSVQERFKAAAVLHYDTPKPYRPESLKDHCDMHQYYTDRRGNI